MNKTDVSGVVEHLPFFISQPGETDIVLIAVLVSLVLIVLGFGALYFTIQAWPDRLAAGANKAQLQIVGILGLISLFTLNNAFWVAGLLIAAIRIPDIVTPLRDISKALAERSDTIETPLREISGASANRSEKTHTPSAGVSEPSADRADTKE